MRRVFTAGAVLALACLSTSALAGEEVFTDQAETQRRVAEIQESVSELRGLPSLRSVPVMVEDPATMRERMAEEMAEQVPPEDMHAITVTWQVFGFVGPDFDLQEVYVSVLEDAVGGYFDVEEQRLVLVRRDLGAQNDVQKQMMQDMVIAHELVHGLQDQHFDLWGLSHRELGNSDVATAVQCLVEGDASYAMLYKVMPAGADPDKIRLDQLAGFMRAAGGVSSTPGGQLGDAPAILRESLIFPYIDGMVFAQAVKVKGGGWKAVDAAFASPPMSTEQILHPERYAPDGDWPMHFDAEGEGWVRGSELLGADTMGEFGVRLFFQEHTPDLGPERLGDGWDGDRYWTYEDDNGAGSLVWRTTWDTEDDATEFATAAALALARLAPESAPQDTGKRAEASSGGVAQVVRQKGVDVVVLIDVPDHARRKAERKALKASSREIRTLDDLAPKPDRPAPPEGASDAESPEE